MNLNPSLDWEKLGDKYYRKQHLYCLKWGKIDFSRYLCAAAPYGGPIALILNFRRIISTQGFNSKPVMSIYNSSGTLINQFQWDRGIIVKLGWISNDRLACVLDQGIVLIYELNGTSTILNMGDVLFIY
jgi:hypothetical protein